MPASRCSSAASAEGSRKIFRLGRNAAAAYDAFLHISTALEQEVRQIGLVYSTDQSPGFSRKLLGKKYAYFDPAGNRLKDWEQISRINSLAIPPAWTHVWICLDENGHLQATGRDQRGRKQAIYHPDFRAFREETKFSRLREFGLALPLIRARVDVDIRRRGAPRDKVVAVLVHLLEATLIRIGNRKYLLENASHGLTTLQNKNLIVGAEKLKFRFKGKSGKFHEIEYRDRRIARMVRSIQSLPGQALFQYVDDDGTPQQVTSNDVNAYIRIATQDDFSAKEFRTWRGTIEALRLLRCIRAAGPITKRKANEVVKQVAEMLGNTPSVCRKSYIHPRLLEEFKDDPDWLLAKAPRARKWLEPVERLAIETLLS